MKTCADAQAELADLVFGELDDVTEMDLNRHLLACDDCRDEERRLLALRDAARAGDPSPAAELRARIHAALRRERPAHGVGLLRRPVPGYVALAAGVLGALLVAALPAREAVRVDGGATRAPAARSLPGATLQGTPLQGAALLPFMIAASSETRVSGATVTSPQRSPRQRSVPEDSL
jgi:anti-sigma factor RsiW